MPNWFQEVKKFHERTNPIALVLVWRTKRILYCHGFWRDDASSSSSWKDVTNTSNAPVRKYERLDYDDSSSSGVVVKGALNSDLAGQEGGGLRHPVSIDDAQSFMTKAQIYATVRGHQDTHNLQLAPLPGKPLLVVPCNDNPDVLGTYDWFKGLVRQRHRESSKDTLQLEFDLEAFEKQNFARIFTLSSRFGAVCNPCYGVVQIPASSLVTPGTATSSLLQSALSPKQNSKFREIQIPGDGNCLYTSIAVGLNQETVDTLNAPPYEFGLIFCDVNDPQNWLKASSRLKQVLGERCRTLQGKYPDDVSKIAGWSPNLCADIEKPGCWRNPGLGTAVVVAEFVLGVSIRVKGKHEEQPSVYDIARRSDLDEETKVALGGNTRLFLRPHPLQIMYLMHVNGNHFNLLVSTQ